MPVRPLYLQHQTTQHGPAQQHSLTQQGPTQQHTPRVTHILYETYLAFGLGLWHGQGLGQGGKTGDNQQRQQGTSTENYHSLNNSSKQPHQRPRPKTKWGLVGQW